MSGFEIFSILIFWLIVWNRWLCWYRAPMPILGKPPHSLGDNPPRISIIVAARNEEASIASCVTSLLSQSYPNYEVVAVNDCSEDRTGPILDELARTHSRLKVVHGQHLLEGWMGKAHALHQGYREAQGDWLLFTDADTHHSPPLLSMVMEAILPTSYSFATLISKTRHPSPGTYLVELAVNAYIFLITDPRNVMNPKSRQSLVNGHYLLFTREAYEAVGHP